MARPRFACKRLTNLKKNYHENKKLIVPVYNHDDFIFAASSCSDSQPVDVVDIQLVASLIDFCRNDCCNKRSLSLLLHCFAKYLSIQLKLSIVFLFVIF